MYISEVHNEAIEEYIDNILHKKGLIHPFINSELAREIKIVAKKVFLAGYKDCERTSELEIRKNKPIINVIRDSADE